MCGIAGILSQHPLADATRIAHAMSTCLAHRGPDGEGFLGITELGRGVRGATPQDLNGHCVHGLLVHRRLAIIDLSTGDQPMSLADGSSWIVFNGEIYNYRELRRELAAGETLQFRTHSDTEVILRVYQRWGIDGFRRLNGIFAFALYDTARRELILARDPVGVKPLYVTETAGTVRFASEIRGLQAGGDVDRRISPEALAQYLYYRFVPAPATLWGAVQKVIPGHVLRFDSSARCVADVDFAAPAPPPHNRGVQAQELSERFEQAVRGQLLADVPVGAFLSGGLDSSLVLAALGARASGFPTFAVGFAPQPGRSTELPIAARAAREFHTHHVAAELDVGSYFGRLPWAVGQTEEPLAHPGMLLQADLSALARRAVKVVLTGQGADEPLGGYPRHQAARVLPLVAGLAARPARSRWLGAWGSRWEVVARIRRVLAAPRGIERTAALFSPVAPQEAGAMVRGCGADAGRTAILSSIERWWNRAEGYDDVARTLYVDVRTSLAEDLLLVSDKMSMAHSLEARVPYLDLDYLAFLEAIPGSKRIGLVGRRKPLQQALARRLLPPKLRRELQSTTHPWRRKHGFDVPVSEWFRKSLRGDLLTFLTGPDSALPTLTDAAEVQKAVRGYLQGGGRSYRRVLSLYVLEIWLRQHFGIGPG
jgi:asparagine synthase (glutamine-hydrolysing)